MRSIRTPARVVGHAGLLVVRGHPPGPDAELEPTVRQQVEGGGLLGQYDRVAVVVAPHQGADPKGFGGVGRGHQRGHRGQLLVEVVGHRDRAVAAVLDPAGQVDPLGPGGRHFRLHAEAEGASHGLEPRGAVGRFRSRCAERPSVQPDQVGSATQS